MSRTQELYKQAADLLSQAKTALAAEGEISEERQAEIDTWVKNAKEIKARAEKLKQVMNEDIDARNSVQAEELAEAELKTRKTGKDLEYKHFHEYMIDIYKHHKRGKLSEKLANLEVRDLAGNVGTQGGFLLPTEHKNEILSVRGENSIARGRARVIPMASRVLEYPALDHSGTTAGESALYGGVQVYWTEENTNITESQPTFKNVNLHLRELAGYAEVPNGLIADSPISLESFLRGPGSFGGALGFKEDYAFLRGSGVGQPLGVLNAPAALATTRNTSNDFKFVDAVTMKSKLLMASSNAVWVINQSVMPKLYQFQGGNSENIWVVNAANGAPESLLGHPIIWTEKLPALGTAGDVMLIDFSMYLIGDRNQITMDVSTDHQFQKNQTAFRVVEAVDGQPWLSSTIQLADGSTIVSPFVYLN